MPRPWPFGSFAPQPARSAASSITFLIRAVLERIGLERCPVVRVFSVVDGTMCRGLPTRSSRYSLGSRRAAAASSSTNVQTANACGMFETDRNQPIRT